LAGLPAHWSLFTASLPSLFQALNAHAFAWLFAHGAIRLSLMSSELRQYSSGYYWFTPAVWVVLANNTGLAWVRLGWVGLLGWVSLGFVRHPLLLGLVRLSNITLGLGSSPLTTNCHTMAWLGCLSVCRLIVA